MLTLAKPHFFMILLLCLSALSDSVFSGLAFSADSNTPKKTSAEYWDETGINFNELDRQVNQEICYKKLENFLGCLSALNTVFSFGTKSLTIIPTSLFNSKEHQWIASYGKQVNLVERALQKPEGTESNDVDLFTKREKFKKERTEILAAWKRIFESNSKELDFDNLTYRAELHGRSAVLDAPVSDNGSIKINEPLMAASAINEFIMVVTDPHSGIVPTAKIQDDTTSTSEQFFGIGANLNPAPDGIILRNIMEDSPALAAGLRAKDLVTQIDGTAIKGKSVESIVSMIRGPEGSEVKLTVIRAQKEMVITVKRGAVKLENIVAKTLIQGSKKIGYIRLRSFMEAAACDRIKNEVKKMVADSIQSLILDLRENPGGRLDQAVCISNIFLKKNRLVVEQRPTPGAPQETRRINFTTQEDAITDLPMVTLIDAGSASASEIVSGALQDQKRSLLLGERSFGKATVQSLGQLQSNPKIIYKQTVARFYLPSGRTNQITGVSPDIAVYGSPHPAKNDMIAFREEDLYTNALPPTGPAWIQQRPGYVLKIQACMSMNNSAQIAYDQGQNAAILPDFQLLAAKDAAYCLVLYPNE